MGEVRDGGTGDGDARQPADLDALVVLDLGDGRADDVHELDRLAPLPGRGGPGEDHQALGVPAHTGRQVVEAEQVGEFVGVLGPALHGVEQGELFVQQDLAAAGEVDEDLGDAGAQLGLLDGGFDGGALEGVQCLADVADLVPVVLQARDLGLHVDHFAHGQAAHHAGEPDAGRLVGVQAELAQVADEAAADADRQEQREQEGDQPQDTGDGRLEDDVHRDGTDAVLVAVVGLVVEGAELVQHGTGGGVPGLRGHVVERPRLRGGGGLFGHAQRGAGRVLPEAFEVPALRGGQQRQVDVVHQGALRDEVGDVAGLVPGELADDQGGTEQGVLTGEELAGPGEVDEGAVLLVHLHVVDDVEVGQQDVARVDEVVVETEGLGPVDGAVLDAAAQRLESVEGVEDRGDPAVGGLPHRVADVRVLGVLTDLGDGRVGRGAAAPEVGEAVGRARIGEVDEGLAAFPLDDSDAVLGGIADLLDHRRHVEQVSGRTAGDDRGERPDRGQGHEGHEKERHDLPADGLPAKAHGLPQLDPRRPGAHMCVNKRREPTTDTEVTRRAVRSLNARRSGETWGVVRSLREIAAPISPGSSHPTRSVHLASWPEFFACLGIFVACCSSFSTGHGERNRPHEPHPQPCGVKQRKPGTHWGAEVFGLGASGSPAVGRTR